MGPLASLSILSLTMALFTFFFGLLPLTLRLSRLTLRILEVAGAGLLLGAACSVVLPEGAGTVFRDRGGEQGHRGNDGAGIEGADPENLLAISFLTGVLVMFLIDLVMAPGAHTHDIYHDEELQASSSSQHVSISRSPSHPHLTHPPSRPIRRLTRPESLVLTRSSAVIQTDNPLEEALSNEANRGSRPFDGLPVSASSHRAGRGSTLARGGGNNGSAPSLGMLQQENLADSETDEASLPADYETFPDSNKGYPSFRSLSQKSHSSSQPALEFPDESPLLDATHSLPSTSRPRPSRGASRRSSYASQSRGRGAVGNSRGLRHAFTSIAGLIIHAACDGIAMGASSASKDDGLKLIVVGAILIHKAPAAFGLCSLLLSQRLSRGDIKRAMGIFSLATPIGAFATYLFLSIFFTSPASTEGPGLAISAKHVGSALTFSAGSFLFVALDAVHELASHSADVYTVLIPTSATAATGAHPEGGEEGQGQGQAGLGELVDDPLEEDEGDEVVNDGESNHPTVRHIPGTIPVERQILGRTGRILVLVAGAVLPRSLQMLIGHEH